MNKDAKIIKTQDGSDTLYLPDLDEHYHSVHGARQESEYVYIKMGLEYWISQNPDASTVKILEVGFGTGINALLSLNFANEHNIHIDYTTLEPYPLSVKLINKLDFNFSEVEKNNFLEIHNIDWNKVNRVSETFNLLKKDIKLEDFNSEKSYDIIYFDAFAPNKQKNIWGSGNLLRLKSVLYKQSGILVTYCAQGQFKRDAKQVGFKVTSLQGPPKKIEMVRLSH